MSNKVKINKNTGEIFIYSSESREDRGIVLKKVDGILSFPIKLEEIEGNKDKKTIYSLYYEDYLLNDSVLLFTYESREDAIATRKAIEKAYRKGSQSTSTTLLKIIIAIAIILLTGKYLFNNNSSEALYNSNMQSMNSATNPQYNRNEIMKTVEDFKNKNNVKKALQEPKKDDSINTDLKSSIEQAKNKEVKETQGQEFADFLNSTK